MDTLRNRILDLLALESRPMLASEVAERIGTKLRSAASTLANMEKEGLTVSVEAPPVEAGRINLLHSLARKDPHYIQHQVSEHHDGTVKRVVFGNGIVRVQFGKQWKPGKAQVARRGISSASSLANLQGAI